MSLEVKISGLAVMSFLCLVWFYSVIQSSFVVLSLFTLVLLFFMSFECSLFYFVVFSGVSGYSFPCLIILSFCPSQSVSLLFTLLSLSQALVFPCWILGFELLEF